MISCFQEVIIYFKVHYFLLKLYNPSTVIFLEVSKSVYCINRNRNY